MGNRKILLLIIFFFLSSIAVSLVSQNVFADCSGSVTCATYVNVCSVDGSTSCVNPGQPCYVKPSTGSIYLQGTCESKKTYAAGSCSGTSTCTPTCQPGYSVSSNSCATTTTSTSGQCTSGEWSGCGGNKGACGSQYVQQCNSSGQWGSCQWDPTKCVGTSSSTSTTNTSGNTCSGITYSTVPTTPVASQPLELLISRANATSTCGINNVGLIYDGVSYWSPNHGFTLSLNGSTGYKADFTSIPSGTHTFQFTFANDACKCNTYSLAVSSGVGTTTTIPSGSISQTTIPTITAPPGCSLKTQGDANCDGKVDDADYQIWKCEFLGGGNCTNPASHLTASFDLNTKVDLVDFEIWREHSSTTADAPTITHVPLPTTAATATTVPLPTPTIIAGLKNFGECTATVIVPNAPAIFDIQNNKWKVYRFHANTEKYTIRLVNNSSDVSLWKNIEFTGEGINQDICPSPMVLSGVIFDVTPPSFTNGVFSKDIVTVPGKDYVVWFHATTDTITNVGYTIQINSQGITPTAAP